MEVDHVENAEDGDQAISAMELEGAREGGKRERERETGSEGEGGRGRRRSEKAEFSPVQSLTSRS